MNCGYSREIKLLEYEMNVYDGIIDSTIRKQTVVDEM